MKEEQHNDVQIEVKQETEQEKADIQLPSNYPDVSQIQAEIPPKSILASQQVKSSTLTPLRVKNERPPDLKPRPHSSFIESELKDKRKEGFEIQLTPHDKTDVLIKNEMAEDSLVAFRPSSVHQQVPGEIESTRGIKRPALGSGSFHFSITKNRDGERPRSGSFVEQVEHRNIAKKNMDDRPFSSMKEKEDLLQAKEGGFTSAKIKQEAAPPKSSVFPQERTDSFKKMESQTTSKSITTDTGTVVVEEVESSQEVVEEAVEAQEVQEEEGKTKFGIKLRSTSQSLKFRSDTSSNRPSKPPASGDNKKTQAISDNATCAFKEQLPANTSSSTFTTADIQLPSEFLRNLKNSQEHF